MVLRDLESVLLSPCNLTSFFVNPMNQEAFKLVFLLICAMERARLREFW